MRGRDKLNFSDSPNRQENGDKLTLTYLGSTVAAVAAIAGAVYAAANGQPAISACLGLSIPQILSVNLACDTVHNSLNLQENKNLKVVNAFTQALEAPGRQEFVNKCSLVFGALCLGTALYFNAHPIEAPKSSTAATQHSSSAATANTVKQARHSAPV